MADRKVNKMRRGYPPPSMADYPLLRVLIAEATRRGDTLAAMAAALGVSYVRVAQWRRKEADIANASRVVLEASARYLKVPTIFVLCLAGIVGLEDFMLPGKMAMRERVRADLTRLRNDPLFAGFVPDALSTVDLSVQRFVAFLYREVSGGSEGGRQFEWMRALELAALGHSKSQSELAAFIAQGVSGRSQFD